jgi:hypothetical protein
MLMRTNACISGIVGAIFAAGLAVNPAFAQDQNQQQQYPPPQQYPQTQQYPQQQYPPPQGQYPPPQGQYPPPQGQYPPPQGQYPPPQGQYPPPQGQYPAGQYGPPPQMMAPQQLDQLVSRIALYPDGLLAQILTASTYFNEIPDAAGWANQHGGLHGDDLARAIQEDRLPWDQSVIALLPFPQVLQMMAQDMGWTQALGNAVLAQRPDVMDAVQRERQKAYNYGNLQNNQYEQVNVVGPGDIEIMPVSPGYYYVPYYDPYVVFGRPHVFGAIRFGPGIVLGASFAPWGWGGVGFGWREHSILVDRRPWGRTWVNRQVYVHPYAVPREHYEGPRVEHHDFRGHEQPRGREEHGHDDHGHNR